MNNKLSKKNIEKLKQYFIKHDAKQNNKKNAGAGVVAPADKKFLPGRTC